MFVVSKVKGNPIRNSWIFLGITWIVGLLFGGFVAFDFSEFWKSIFYEFASESRFAFYFLLPSLLPFLFSAFAVYLSLPRVLFLVCAIKAFLFGLCGVCVCLIYLQSAWLALLLLMFTDLCSMPVLYLYWLRCLCNRKPMLQGLDVCFGLYFVAISGVDCFLIWPFAEQLFSI